MMKINRENPNKYFDETDATYEACKLWDGKFSFIEKK